MLASIWSGNDIIYFCSIGALIIAFYQIGSKRSEEKRRQKAEADKAKAIAAGREKAASERLEDRVTEALDGIRLLRSVIFDRQPSDGEPEGHKGILSTQIMQGRILTRMAQRQGLSTDLVQPGPYILDPNPPADEPQEKP